MAKKLSKKIAKAALAAGAAYGMSKAMAGKKDWRSNLKHTYGKRSIKQVGGDAKIAEAIHGAKHFRKPSMLGDVGGSMDHMSGRKKWWQVWKNKGGPINAYQGDLVKSETRGTGAAVKGTTHEVMPGMDAAKKGKLIKARHGTQVRTRGSNPDNPYVTQGGEVQIATKLNGTLKTRTW